MNHPEQTQAKTQTTASLAHDTVDQAEQAWFDEPKNRRSSSAPPPPVEKLGEFLGDPLADNWLR